MTADIVLLLLLAFCVWQLLRVSEKLDRQEAHWQSLLRHLGVTPGQLAEPSDEVKALARQPGKHIEAIRAYREQTGLGLKEAKDVIDRISRD
jgi:ribosomal protein L7/L12